MPPQRECDRPRRVLVDEEAASAPHTLTPQGEPHFPLGFQVSSMPQSGFF